MMKELETSRLHLRRLGLENLYDYYEGLMSDGEVTKFLPCEPHQDIGESLAVIEQSGEREEAGEGFCWAILRKDDDAFLGTAELTDLDREADSCGLVCMLIREHWNQGYATEALQELLRFAVEELGIRSITADHMAPNAAAGRVMEKAGMTPAGRISGKYEKHGRVHDALVYELVRADADPLSANEYQKLAMSTLNLELTKKDVLLNGVMGLCGEAGECIDLVKKHLHQGHDLDREKLAKELGDVAWYLAETAYALDLKLEDILRGNLEKLRKRYPQGFDREKSINR